jgi:transposase
MDYFIGIDIGDKINTVCVLNNDGEIIQECEVENTGQEMHDFFIEYPNARVAIEACSHSLWLHDLLVRLGCQVFVGNPRKLRIISSSSRKNDKNDSRLLARLVRSDLDLLYPIVVRDILTQQDMVIIKTRTMLIKTRGDLVRHIRGIIKPFGLKLPKDVTTDNFHDKVKEHLSKELLPILKHTIKSIKDLSIQIKNLDKKIDSLINKKYPEAMLLQTIDGIGPITALTFILIMGDPKRFEKSRDVGAYFGLVPRQDQSCTIDKSLPITKEGDSCMRSLLVNCSHHILGRYGKDTQIRRHGLKVMGQDENKIRKKKAVIAVARKLSVLMHSMLISGEPFINKVA